MNPSDLLSKHWGHSQIWPMLQPLMFWQGDTADLTSRRGVLKTDRLLMTV